MAQIYMKRKQWCIEYYDSEGKRRRELVGKDLKQARDILAKRQWEAVERREFPKRAANSQPFNALIDRYFELHGPMLRSDCWRLMLNDLRPALGAKKAGAITPADVQAYYNKIAARASVSTANRHLTLVKAIFNRAKALEYFQGENPASKIKKEKEPANRLRYLNVEEMQKLLNAAHPRLYPILACALLTGMRLGEIMDLDWQNVNLERGIIYILLSKSGKPREIPIANKLREVFLSLKPKKSGVVFDLPYIMLRRFFAKALEETQIPTGFRFHDTRHTFASHFIMRTNDLPALQNILGHSSPAMTQRYAHLSRSHLVSEMALFESAIPVSLSSERREGPRLAQNGHKPFEAQHVGA